MNAGDMIDGFELIRKLGGGGNADVWEARHGEFGVVALKILRSRKVQSEPYARFRQETQTLQQLGRRPGVVPVLDSYVPETLAADRRAWFAMPIAVRLDEALEGASLEDVVSAVAAIAGVLASLAEEQDIYHRDLKPSNLYMHEDGPAVGDFGLAAVPDADDLTRSDRAFGPANFVPYEVIMNPVTAEPGPADVYALAKSLWVLASGQRWAPLGEQNAGRDGVSLRSYIAHRNLQQLDDLIERCTLHAPQDRPTMRDFAADLSAWTERAAQSSSEFDLASYAERLKEVAAPRLDEVARRRSLEQRGAELSDLLAQRMAPIEHAISRIYEIADCDTYDEGVYNTLRYREHLGSAQIIVDEARATIVTGPGYTPFALTVGRYVGITDDAKTHIAGVVEVALARVLGGNRFRWEHNFKPVPADSIRGETNIAELGDMVEQNLPQALDEFIHALKGDEGEAAPPDASRPKDSHESWSDGERQENRA